MGNRIMTIRNKVVSKFEYRLRSWEFTSEVISDLSLEEVDYLIEWRYDLIDELSVSEGSNLHNRLVSEINQLGYIKLHKAIDQREQLNRLFALS